MTTVVSLTLFLINSQAHSPRLPNSRAESWVVATKSRLYILLPPSEGKALSGTPNTKWKESDGTFGQSLAEQRTKIVEVLTAAGGGSPKLLGVSGNHLARAQRANISLCGAPTLPACERYTGVVWDQLNISSLPSVARTLAQTNILIVSGLLGLVTASDPIPDYRLKNGASLAPLGKLSNWWRKDISRVLNKHCAGCTVIDLLPQEHFAAFEPDEAMLGAYLRVGLVTNEGATGGHDAKAAKGRLARHLIVNSKDPHAALKSFNDSRYRVLFRVSGAYPVKLERQAR